MTIYIIYIYVPHCSPERLYTATKVVNVVKFANSKITFRKNYLAEKIVQLLIQHFLLSCPSAVIYYCNRNVSQEFET